MLEEHAVMQRPLNLLPIFFSFQTPKSPKAGARLETDHVFQDVFSRGLEEKVPKLLLASRHLAGANNTTPAVQTSQTPILSRDQLKQGSL